MEWVGWKILKIKKDKGGFHHGMAVDDTYVYILYFYNPNSFVKKVPETQWNGIRFKKANAVFLPLIFCLYNTYVYVGLIWSF